MSEARIEARTGLKPAWLRGFAAVSKTVRGASPAGVQIPPPPPNEDGTRGPARLGRRGGNLKGPPASPLDGRYAPALRPDGQRELRGRRRLERVGHLHPEAEGARRSRRAAPRACRRRRRRTVSGTCPAEASSRERCGTRTAHRRRSARAETCMTCPRLRS